jgi:hypothetical protein
VKTPGPAPLLRHQGVLRFTVNGCNSGGAVVCEEVTMVGFEPKVVPIDRACLPTSTFPFGHNKGGRPALKQIQPASPSNAETVSARAEG